ncbi:protein of unknown function [Candidatus Methylocalor cossyra]|uniref:Uncharacterized protein n=1 Tax=Candidatus Methylocalor cossyra TaxID=3108543 RepID=A0ABM9NEC0_9GAMM
MNPPQQVTPLPSPGLGRRHPDPAALARRAERSVRELARLGIVSALGGIKAQDSCNLGVLAWVAWHAERQRKGRQRTTLRGWV